MIRTPLPAEFVLNALDEVDRRPWPEVFEIVEAEKGRLYAVSRKSVRRHLRDLVADGRVICHERAGARHEHLYARARP